MCKRIMAGTKIMCKLIVCAIAQTNSTNIYYDTKLPKVGDVLAAVDDAHVFGIAENTDSQWRILILPGFDVSAVGNLLSEEIPTAPLNPRAPNTMQYRGYFINSSMVNGIPGMAAYLADDSRASADFALPNGVDFSSAISKRPPVADPAVVG